MPRRRKVGNLLALAVLATLVERPMHPYEIASLLRARGKERDMKIKWGSFYTVVRNLEKHGLLAATGSERMGARPERTVYTITDPGREELLSWVRELVSTPEPEQRRFEAGLSVMAVLPPDEVIALLGQRLDHLEAGIAQARSELDGHRAEIPRLFLVEVEYDLALREAEAAWVRALLDDLTSGAFPGLDEWAEFHRTGERSKP
jgi:DNA-binding PadR family transcriptional regulator